VCRECFSEYNRKRYLAQRESIKARVRERYWADPDKVRAEGRRTYAKYAEDRRARAREYMRTHDRSEYKREWARADRAANPEKWRERSRRDYQRNPEARKAIDHRRRAKKIGRLAATVTADMLRLKWLYWAGLCWMCGNAAIEWDHVKPLTKGGSHCLANLRPACRSCNAHKGNRWPWATGRK